MSYCVNCGVKLDDSAKSCALCGTPVINPNELISPEKADSPFPREKGQVEVVKRRDLAILLTVVLISTAVGCGVLNFLFYNGFPWSLAIIGACIILWVFFIPAMLVTRIPPYVTILLDGLIVCGYLFTLTFMTQHDQWFLYLGLPIASLVTILIEITTVLVRKVSSQFLNVALYFFIMIAVLCMGIEVFIRLYVGSAFALTWSAVVLTVCLIIIIALITTISKKRLRNAVRRRFHF